MKCRVLLVDDDTALGETLQADLSERGHAAEFVTSAAGAETMLSDTDFDVVITDLNMQGTGGLELCKEIGAHRSDLPVIVLTAFGSYDTAIGAIRAGAYDFISKPVELDVLAIAVERAATHKQLRAELKRLQQNADRKPFGLVGNSPAMRAVFELVDRIADSEATVLVTGESGTGKEVIARALHERGPRRHGPFVAINCAAIPEGLLESELFGHAKGAFTDARAARRGIFVEACGGTLLLDEVGDMPLALQPKLLRVLQDRVVRPIGSNAEVPIDLRIVAASHRDLESAVDEGRFREDLYYRINVVRVDLPPLRARSSDVLPLAMHFARDFATREKKAITGIAPPAAERLVAYTWPGNVRELQNCIERAVALARFEQIGLDDLPERVRDHRQSYVIVASDDPAELVSMEEVERRYIARVMEAVGGNKTAAARILGFDRKRLYRMIDRLGIDPHKRS